MRKQKILLLLTVCLLLVSLNLTVTKSFATESNEILLTFEFPTPIITDGSHGVSILMDGLPVYGAPSEPILPFRLVKALIPQGKGVKSINVDVGDKVVLDGKFFVDYGKTPLPILPDVIADDQPNDAIYNSEDPFPGVLFSDVSVQYFRGCKILMLKLHPVQYVPKTGEISYFKTMALTITLDETGDISPLFRGLPQDRDLVASFVDNPGEIQTYTQTLDPPRSNLVDPLDSYSYVIITTNALKSSFQPLINSKIAEGLTATIVTVEDIMKEPAYNWNGVFGDGYSQFNDTQAHIRNFIKDAYLNWETEYVLLGGDAGPTTVIPYRGIYCYGGDYTKIIPSDMYYAALDGSWDADRDGYFGETVYRWTTPPPGHTTAPRNGTAGEEADFFIEVWIGRAPVTTTAQATRFIEKTLAYEQDVQTNPEAPYLQNALLIGESLDAITQGGNGQDRVAEIIQYYTLTRLYARDGTHSATTVRSQLSSGNYLVVCHDGHSSSSSVMSCSRTQASGLTNQKYFFVYTLGCDSAAFEVDSVAERFITSTTGGAFAYIGNSRYGWYVQGSTDGAGDRYMRQFFLVINDGFKNLGKALALSKMREPVLDRWTVFELTLLGDPETQLFTSVKAPTAFFEVRTDLLAVPRIGGVVELRGTAKRGPAEGSTFSNYVIEFGSGTSPTTWSNLGITLANGGSSEVINGILATWNTTLVSEGTYTLRLRVFDTEGRVGEDRKIVMVRRATQPIYIRADGSIEPSTEYIERDGNVYTLTGNIAAEGDIIVIEKDNIVLDGAGYTIQGLVGKYGAGIRLIERSNVTIRNIVITNCLYGIYFELTNRSVISGCTAQGNTHGIFLYKSSNNKLTGNSLTSNSYGIAFMFLSNNNIVYENWITNNQGRDAGAVWFYYSSNNAFDHNVFINNYRHVYDAAWDCSDPLLIAPSINIWDDDYPSGGNYWSGYTGQDLYWGPCQDRLGSDGIGDTPYIIDVNNKDRYPLMNPYRPRALRATVDTGPVSLNLRSSGVWVTAYVELPEGYDVGGIDVSTVLVNFTVPVDAYAPFTIGDYDGDGTPDLMVKFSRAEIISFILGNINIEDGFGTATLRITGYLTDGTPFQGTATIKIILPTTKEKLTTLEFNY
ncbi:MAG: C25 family cysteine peptidase [Candidatus Bathyarchaeia archaeon]